MSPFIKRLRSQTSSSGHLGFQEKREWKKNKSKRELPSFLDEKMLRNVCMVTMEKYS